MAKVKDVLQYVAYGVALDFWEVNHRQVRHLFPYSDLTTRETIEQHHPELLERELAGGIHAEGSRKDNIVIPVKAKEEMKKNEQH